MRSKRGNDPVREHSRALLQEERRQFRADVEAIICQQLTETIEPDEDHAEQDDGPTGEPLE